MLIRRSQPTAADHNQDHVALPQRTLDLTSEVHAERDGVDVEEDVACAELSCEAISDAARTSDRILPTVRDEDPQRSPRHNHPPDSSDPQAPRLRPVVTVTR